MITGVETAGLILATLPLVISALEHYSEGVKPLKDFVRYKATIRALICDLGTQRALFRNTLERLLGGIVFSNVEIAILLDSPSGPRWKDEKLACKLSERLQHSEGVYTQCVENIEHHLRALGDHIGLDESGRPLWFDARSHRKAWKRFTVCLARKEHESLLRRLDQDNRNLMNLTKDSLELEPLRQSRRIKSEPFRKIREYLRSLHDVLKRSWCYNCSSPHTAHLRLETRNTDSDPSFRVLFQRLTPLPHSTALSWQETEMRPLSTVEKPAQNLQRPSSDNHIAADITQDMSGSHSQMAIMSASVQLSALSGSVPGQYSLPFRPKQKEKSSLKKVSWASQLQGPSIDQPKPSNQPLHHAQAGTNLSSISNLCQSFQHIDCRRQEEWCLGCLKSEDHTLEVYAVGLRPYGPHLGPPITTLSDILGPSMTPVRDCGTLLNKKQRLQLAFTLASTTLQMYGTPWLQRSFGKKDILFHDGPTERPYISKSFSQESSSECDDVHRNNAKTWTPIRNESLFDLGVLLIELSYGKPLESLRVPEDPPLFTEYAIATRLVNILAEEELPGYADATKACIFCDFTSRVKVLSFENEFFRQAFYEDVLVPLEDDWGYWNK